MSNIWKAVSGLFKAKEKMEEKDKEKKDEEKPEVIKDVNADDEDGSDDSEDEDFVPNEANDGALSEEASDDDVDDEDGAGKTDKKTKIGSGRKRKAPKKPSGLGLLNAGRISKRGRFAELEEDDNKSSLDDSFHSLDPSDNIGEEEADTTEEAEEKAETDKLWADFLTSVEEEKVKRNQARSQRTVEKVVNKIYDFAGEKVSVQEKVKVTLSNGSKDDDQICSSSSFLHSEPIAGPSSAMRPPPPKTSTNSPNKNGEPQPGPSSAMKLTNGSTDKNNPNPSTSKPPEKRRRGGISILGNDPELIGLDELDKKGLSGLLRAFQNKSKLAKIGTLEKSKLDWESFKRQQGLDEELQNHNKSRNTFIDKQEFLQRTDQRQFELEKSMRATQRSKRLNN